MAEVTALTNLRNYINAGFRADRDRVRLNGQREWFELAMIGATQVSSQVNDTETIGDWTESDSGTWDVTANTTDVRTGTNNILILTTAGTDGTQYVETRLVSGSALPSGPPDPNSRTASQDWRDTDYVGFWLAANAASDFDADGELQFALVNLNRDGIETLGTKISVQAAVNAVHQRAEVDISGETRDRVVAIRFYGNNAAVGEGVEIDAIIRYKWSNGKGPVWGDCVRVPITSGSTVTRGQIVQVNVDSASGLDVSAEAAVAVNTNGPVVVGGTGVAGGTVYAIVQLNGFAYLRTNAATVAGENLIWQSVNATHGHLVEGGATGVDENGIAKGLEAAGAQFDDFLVELTRTATFIS